MVILRVVDRILLRKVSLDWDDYFVVIAVVCLFGTFLPFVHADS